MNKHRGDMRLKMSDVYFGFAIFSGSKPGDPGFPQRK